MSRIFLFLLLTIIATSANFEPRPVHPLTITTDGSRLLAVNPAEGRLSIFAIGPVEHVRPILISEIPVGLVPVSVRLLNDDEAWVINELSDTISVVSLSKNRTIATIHTGDEPADLAFSQGNAYLTCSRDNSVEVYDVVTRARTATIPLQGLLPRAIALSPDGTEIYIGFQHTSNGSTILPRHIAPSQTIPPNFNPDLPAPPKVAQIVATNDAAINYTVLDHDIANLTVSNHAVSYIGNIGTNILALAILTDGRLLSANTESRNLITFEPELTGRFTLNRLATVDGNAVTQFHLNNDPDPGFPLISTASAATALAQPMALWVENENRVWLAAYGSDRVSLLDTTSSTIGQRIDLRALDPPAEPRSGDTVRGPRGLARHPSQPWLYCYNKLSHTLSIIDTRSNLVVAEVPLSSFPDLKPDLKMGRAFLQDARLSGNGSVSCASCHIDLERDGLAWDLGNPAGSMLTLTGFLRSVHLYNSPITHHLHPMKGPMTTQTLLGLRDQSKLHWRGDKPTIQSFNSSFPNLLGGSELSASEMDSIANYLLTLNHHPNPYQQLDRTPPTSLEGGDPLAGVAVFARFENHCIECHSLPSGTSNNLDLPGTVGSFQPLKDPPLRTLYQRKHFNSGPGKNSITGFGMLSDGSGSEFPIVHPYSLHILDEPSRPLSVREKEKRDLTAFLLSFDTGTAPAVGAQVAFSKTTTLPPVKRQRLLTLEEQTKGDFPSSGLILRGIFQGQPRNFRYLPGEETYLSDTDLIANQTFTRLFAAMETDDFLIATGVPLGTAAKFSTDRNQDGQRDAQQETPILKIAPDRSLSWVTGDNGWHLQKTENLKLWQPATLPLSQTAGDFTTPPTGTETARFFRLQRNW